MEKTIKLYSIVITLLAIALLFTNQKLTTLNRELLEVNYELINISNELLEQIDTKQTEYTDLMVMYLNAEYDAMTRVVKIYCGD
jgi:hypothetical protein